MAKPQTEAFTQSWDKTIAWAKSRNIPFQAYYPVYQMDVQRFTTGYQMSEADRINAIQAAAGLSATTALPTPSPTNVLKNAGNNLAQIFTGLNPFGAGGGLLGNIFDTLKNTIEHPSSFYSFFEPQFKNGALASVEATLQHMSDNVLGPHDILSWFPGFYDLGEVVKGKAGLKQLADSPITSLLDVLPLGKALPKSISESVLGDSVASRLGVTKDAVGKMDSVQLGYRMLKSLPMPLTKIGGPIYDAKGSAIGWKPVSIGQRINLFRNNLGTGWEQGELLKGMIIKGELGTQRLMERLGPVISAIDSLSDEEKILAYKAIQKDYRPLAVKLNDYRYSDNVKNVLQVVHDYTQQDRAIKMQAGDLVTIQTPFGLETYSVKDGANGVVVQRALNYATAAQERLDRGSRRFDLIQQRVFNMDRKAESKFKLLEATTAAIMGTIRKSEPSIAGVSHGVGGATKDVLWTKIVETQSPVVRNLLGLPPMMSAAAQRLFPSIGQGIRLTMHHANAMRDLFSPNGLLDQMVKAYKDSDWLALSRYSKLAMRRFSNSAFDNIPKEGAGAYIFKVKNLTQELHDYAVERSRNQNTLTKLMYGHTDPKLLARGKFRSGSIAALTKAASEAHQEFVRTAIEHPPDVWSNIYMDTLVEKIMSNERSAEIVDKAATYLGQHGIGESEIDKIRKDPQTLVELFVRASKDSFGNGMMPDMDPEMWNQLQKSAYDEIATLRAQGHAPMYIPMISAFDAERIAREGYNVYIGSIRPKSVSSTFARAFEFNGSIYNVAMGLMKDAKEQITNDVVREYFSEYFSKHLHSVEEVNQQATVYAAAQLKEMSELAARRGEVGFAEKHLDTVVAEHIKRANLITYNPDSIFGHGFSMPKLNGEFYVDRGLADAVTKSVSQFQFPAEGFLDKGTQLFRFSILQLSPRYTAHILVGGTALVAYRGHLSMFKHIGAAAHVFKTGQLPERILKEFPHAQEHMTTQAAQEGVAMRAFHSAAMFSMGNKIIQEWLDNHQIAATGLNWTKAAGQINMRFTRAIVRAQRAVVYLDGAERALKSGEITELVPEKVLDEYGNEVLNPQSGKPVWREVEKKTKVSPEQAHHAGMEAVSEVMGELRHMTPLERSVFVRIFPFYGWTKHVLTYVMTYPIDHPYRATFLSQLATQNSQDLASGLPTRIQLLTLLGKPDAYGNVSAIDTRVFDPLRDTANYASVTGFWQSLNPVFSAPAAYVDPQIVFGSNELYPHLTYNQLYGVKTAGPQGNAVTAAEQFVPELTGLDAALNLSGQYAYLKAQGGDGFTKKIFQSLNVPFFQIQHINLRQIAAQNEIDRFTQAKNDALAAAQSGDMSSLSGYSPTAEVPDPLNPLYNVTPAYINAMNTESERKYHLPMYQTTPPPPNPPL